MERIEENGWDSHEGWTRYKTEDGKILNEDNLKRLEDLTIEIEHMEFLGKNPHFKQLNKICSEMISLKVKTITKEKDAQFYNIYIDKTTMNPGIKIFWKTLVPGTLTTHAYIYFYNLKNNSPK